MRFCAPVFFHYLLFSKAIPFLWKMLSVTIKHVSGRMKKKLRFPMNHVAAMLILKG